MQMCIYGGANKLNIYCDGHDRRNLFARSKRIWFYAGEGYQLSVCKCYLRIEEESFIMGQLNCDWVMAHCQSAIRFITAAPDNIHIISKTKYISRTKRIVNVKYTSLNLNKTLLI